MTPFWNKKSLTPFFILFFLISCNQQIEKKIETSSNSIDTSVKFQSYSLENKMGTNDLRDPNSNYYMSDIPLNKVGQLMLTDSVYPSDNDITFRLLDTISSCNLTELKFYLSVFDNIMSKSDGALSEAIGSYSFQFIKKRPSHFIKHISFLDKKDIENWASFTAYEIYFNYPEDSLNFYCDKFIDDLKKNNSNKGLELFEKELKNQLKTFKDQ